MVLDGFREIIAQAILLFAGIAAIVGIIVLQQLFHNKLKELFDDIKYFVFFFLVIGYWLYALGEISFYLTKFVEGDESLIGIADLYWTFASLLIFISFIGLSYVVMRQSKDQTKKTIHLIVGLALAAIVAFTTFSFLENPLQEVSYFNYFYPIISSLIVAASLCVFFFNKEVGTLRSPIMIFFAASSAILIGDILFALGTAQNIYLTGSIGVIADLAYSFGYGLSAIAFISMGHHLRTLTQSNK